MQLAFGFTELRAWTLRKVFMIWMERLAHPVQQSTQLARQVVHLVQPEELLACNACHVHASTRPYCFSCFAVIIVLHVCHIHTGANSWYPQGIMPQVYNECFDECLNA